MKRWVARQEMAALVLGVAVALGTLLGCGGSADAPADASTTGLFGKQDVVAVDADTGVATDLQGADSAGETATPACIAAAERCLQGVHQVCGTSGWVAAPCPASLALCVGGKCAACLPGETTCAPPAPGSSTSHQVRKCNADGLGWTVTATCALGQCSQGGCADCEPGKPRCLAGKRQVCASDGKGWVDAPCASELPLCEAGQCVLCVPNLPLCDAVAPGKGEPSLVLQCNAAGDDMQFVKACKVPEYCYSGACVTCVPGSSRCENNSLETCDEAGSGWQPTPCGASKPFCVKGVCLACPPSEKFCGPAELDGSPSVKVLQCDATGKQGQLVKTCSDGQACVAGDCALCGPGVAKCLGLLTLTCDASGASQTASAMCSLKGVGCAAGKCGCSAAGQTCAPAAAGLTISTQTVDCSPAGDEGVAGPWCAVGQRCFDGQCATCKPGQSQCQGQKALQCKVDGSGWQVSQDCTTANQLCVAGKCIDACDPTWANPTPWGCEFYALATENAVAATNPDSGTPGNPAKDAAALALVIANPHGTAVTLTLSNTLNLLDKAFKSQAYTVPALGGLVLPVPDPAWQQVPQWSGGTAAGPLGYRVQTTLPVSIVQHNQALGSLASADTSLLWPANSLGLHYRAAARPQGAPETRGFVAAVATAPGITKVTLVSSAITLAGKDSLGAVLPALLPGETATRDLPQGHAWVVATDAKGSDLTGSLLSADQPFAVFSGNKAAPVPDTTLCQFAAGTPAGAAGVCTATSKPCYADSDCPQVCCADHLEEQLRPLSEWGTQFILPALQPRGDPPEAAVVRIVASQDGTSVFSVPPLLKMPVLKAGQYVELLSKQDLLLYADKPVQVVQWMTSSQLSSAKTTGDPAMAVVPPIARLDSRAMWSNPAPYKQIYLLLAAPMGAAVTLDGKPVVLAPSVPGSGWQVLRIAVPGSGQHQLAADMPVYAMLQGWDEGVSFLHALSWGEF